VETKKKWGWGIILAYDQHLMHMMTDLVQHLALDLGMGMAWSGMPSGMPLAPCQPCHPSSGKPSWHAINHVIQAIPIWE